MAIVNKSTFLELVAAYHENPEKFVFFVGAGLSQPLFPSWGALLKEFLIQAKEGELPHDEDELTGYIDAGENYLDIAETCITAMGTTRYRDLMEKIFDKDFSESDVPEGYKALMELTPKTIITTNYDRIPDIAGKGRYRVSTNKNAPEASRFVADKKNTVFKMHGDITDHSSIILTTNDYQKIISCNQSTRSLLNNLLSTKILIFVGFSLSDPHINTVLENIKAINNGIPLSHYVLLNEKSKFKISSFEKRYGVKVISYTPSDNTHPEVIEFLRALNHESISVVPYQLKPSQPTDINTPEELVKHIESCIEKIIIGSGFSIFYRDNDLYISFTPVGETNSEIQKEILSIIRILNFKCGFIERTHIYVAMKTPPHTNFDKSQVIMIKATLNFADANKYGKREISTSTVWGLIRFYRPPSLSNIFQSEEKIEFPMSMGIIGE